MNPAIPRSSRGKATRREEKKAANRHRLLCGEVLEKRLTLSTLPWQNASNHYDIDANGVADGADVYPLDQELRTFGERMLTAPNGPVQHYWDVDGDDWVRWINQVILLHYLTGTLDQHETNQAAQDAEPLESGGFSSMSSYSVSLNPVGNVAEGTAFSLSGSVSPPGELLLRGHNELGAITR